MSSVRARARASACASKENVHVSSCVPLGARGEEARAREREGEKETEKSYKRGADRRFPPARSRTTVGSLRHQNGRKDSTLAGASVSSLRVQSRRADDDRQVDASSSDREGFAVGATIAPRCFRRHFCYRCFVYNHLPCDDLSLSLSRYLSRSFFLSLAAN